MVTILFATHDWVQVEANGHYYEFSLRHNGLVEEVEWRAEVEAIGEATLEDLQTRYQLREIQEKEVWRGGIQDMKEVRVTHGTTSKAETDWEQEFKIVKDLVLKEHEALKKDAQQTIDFLDVYFPHSKESHELLNFLESQGGIDLSSKFFDNLLLLLIARKYTERKPSDLEIIGMAMYYALKETT